MVKQRLKVEKNGVPTQTLIYFMHKIKCHYYDTGV